MKDWIDIQVPRSIFFLVCSLVILLFLHQGRQNWAIKELEQKSDIAPFVSSRFVSDDEWNCQRGIIAYNQRDYDKALRLFSEINKLSGPAYVRWKFYEAMCYIRREQHKKVVLLDKPDQEAVDSALLRLKTIIQQYPNDILSSDAKYWYAQCFRYFKDDNEIAFNIFQELLDENSDNTDFKWRESTMFYAALILVNNGNDESKKKGNCMLYELVQEYSNNLIQPVEMGRELYKVSWAVKVLTRKLAKSELCKR
ncbi:MAG: tetratricopeptide repeat protein [Candidatus Thorarchaeota archaeon]